MIHVIVVYECAVHGSMPPAASPLLSCDRICHTSARRRGLGRQGLQSTDMTDDIWTNRIW